MTKPTTIYLVRHGESEHNKNRTFSGHGNPALTDTGRAQVRQTKQEFEGIKFDAAYSSTLKRAYETAEIIYGKQVTEDNRLEGLKERSWGSLEGLSYDNVIDTDKDSLSHEEAWHHKYVPDMESDHEVSDRFMKELELQAKNNAGKTILVVAHGGAIRTTLMRIENASYDKFPMGTFRNGGWAKLLYENGKFTLEQVSA